LTSSTVASADTDQGRGSEPGAVEIPRRWLPSSPVTPSNEASTSLASSSAHGSHRHQDIAVPNVKRPQPGGLYRAGVAVTDQSTGATRSGPPA
jgi:hypothetical protein